MCRNRQAFCLRRIESLFNILKLSQNSSIEMVGDLDGCKMMKLVQLPTFMEVDGLLIPHLKALVEGLDEGKDKEEWDMRIMAQLTRAVETATDRTHNNPSMN